VKRLTRISCLFLDIGGVLLTDGWDHNARKRAAATFKLNSSELEELHRQAFEAFELGKLSMKEYLDLTVFHQKRPFTRAQFRAFIFASSKPHSQMINWVQKLKDKYGLKLIVVSNEARELNDYRIRTFKLHTFVDAFVSSCFVGLRKPDADIFRLALDISQVPIRQVLYVDNTPMFVQIAKGLGIRSVHHTDFKSTSEIMASCGLEGDQ